MLLTVLFVMPLWVEGVYESLLKENPNHTDGGCIKEWLLALSMPNLSICYYSRKKKLRNTALTHFHLPEIISGLYKVCVCSFFLYWKLCFPLQCMYFIFLFSVSEQHKVSKGTVTPCCFTAPGTHLTIWRAGQEAVSQRVFPSWIRTFSMDFGRHGDFRKTHSTLRAALLVVILCWDLLSELNCLALAWYLR